MQKKVNIQRKSFTPTTAGEKFTFEVPKNTYKIMLGVARPAVGNVFIDNFTLITFDTSTLVNNTVVGKFEIYDTKDCNCILMNENIEIITGALTLFFLEFYVVQQT